jgi:hypothetical protein
MAGVLKFCAKCGMTTAHLDGCQRCAFIKAHPKRPAKPMTDEVKARLAEANERRKKEREARRRDAQTTNTEEK